MVEIKVGIFLSLPTACTVGECFKTIGHSHPIQFYVPDLTTFQTEMESLAGIEYGGVLGR
jgi:hypothetical protein